MDIKEIALRIAEKDERIAELETYLKSETKDKESAQESFGTVWSKWQRCEKRIAQLEKQRDELLAEVERLSAAHVKACQANADSQAELAKAEQRVAEAIVDMLQQKHRNCFGAHSFYLAASVATANGEWRKFVKEV